MRIDWKSIPPGPSALRYSLPEVTDWMDPTHVPLMVCDALEVIGTTSCAFSLDELDGLAVVAIDAMPNGRDAVVAAVAEVVHELAAIEGWSDCLCDLGTIWDLGSE